MRYVSPSHVPTGALQIVDVVVHVDQLCNPLGHRVEQATSGGITLERCAHLQDVAVDGARCDGLLEAAL